MCGCEMIMIWAFNDIKKAWFIDIWRLHGKVFLILIIACNEDNWLQQKGNDTVNRQGA